MRYYCTLFDETYAAKGKVMIDSLIKYSSEPVFVNVLALNELTAELVKRLLPHVGVTPIQELYQDNWTLKHVPRSRTYAQWCWTLASYFQSWVMEKNNADELTYLDSDLCFFDSPKRCFEEMDYSQSDVGIVPHRFPDHDYKRLIVNGRYNVSWVTFRRMASWLLNDWKDKCIAKCDDTTCGDQKYLDDWPTMANMGGNKVHEFESIGIGAGPWNGYTYRYHFRGDGKVAVALDGNWDNLIFYHFHEFKKKVNPQHKRDFRLTGYPVNETQMKCVYEPYIEAIVKAEEEIEKIYAKGL